MCKVDRYDCVTDSVAMLSEYIVNMYSIIYSRRRQTELRKFMLHKLRAGSLVATALTTKWACTVGLRELTCRPHAQPSKVVHLEQLVKKFPIFKGTRRFITVFINAHCWTLS
jgi:hypothetical protein